MRLSANFVNLEVTVTGVPKLRIPTTLLREKQRTAKRFSVTKPQSKPQTNSHQYLKIRLKTDPGIYNPMVRILVEFHELYIYYEAQTVS
jgi:hypothetical protein